MTIETTSTYTRSPGNGSTITFNFAFAIFDASDLVVSEVLDATGVASVKSLVADYSVAFSPGTEGGSISLTTPTAIGRTVDIRSNVARTQREDIRNQGRFLPEIHEHVFDRLERQIQDVHRLANLAIRLPDYGPDYPSVLPPASARANSYIVLDPAGNLGLALTPPAGNLINLPVATDTGSVNVITCALPGFALASFALAWVRVLNTTTSTTPTLNVQGTGAKSIVNADGSALLVGALAAGGCYSFMYDGARYQLLSLTQAARLTSLTAGSATISTATVNGIDVTPQNGSFTATLTTMASATTGTINYYVRSGFATLYAPGDILGTGTGNTMSMSGLPAIVQGLVDVDCMCIVINNNTAVPGRAKYFQVTQTIGFSPASANTGTGVVSYLATGFAAATKGILKGWSITYPLS